MQCDGDGVVRVKSCGVLLIGSTVVSTKWDHGRNRPRRRIIDIIRCMLSHGPALNKKKEGLCDVARGWVP